MAILNIRSCGTEFQMWGPKQEKVRKPWVLCLYCWISSMRVSEEECVVYKTECRHAAGALQQSFKFSGQVGWQN